MSVYNNEGLSVAQAKAHYGSKFGWLNGLLNSNFGPSNVEMEVSDENDEVRYHVYSPEGKRTSLVVQWVPRKMVGGVSTKQAGGKEMPDNQTSRDWYVGWVKEVQQSFGISDKKIKEGKMKKDK